MGHSPSWGLMVVRSSVVFTIALASISWLMPLRGIGEEPSISPALHPWGRFDPGAWKTVRVITETLNEQGQVVSTTTTDTKTTLVDRDHDGVTLEIQACMEVAGKRFSADSQLVKQGYYGELLCPNLRAQPPTDDQVIIEAQKIPCKVQRLESDAVSGRTSITLYCSTTIAPYVLRRECVASDAQGKTVETHVEVLALNMPVEVRAEMKNGIKVKTVRTDSAGTVTTWADVVPEVPGGVVKNSSREVDKTGRLVRRSTLVLVDYSDDPDKDRSGLFRSRKRHRTKTASRYGA